MRQRLTDVVVIIPGIIGSTLSRRGTPLWRPSHRLLGKAVLRPAATAASLALGDGDEVVADGLMPDACLVAGLWKVDGYTRLTEAIAAHFDVRRAVAAPAPQTATPPANLVEFPYDWRQDNRISAERLAAVAERALAAWRAYAHVPDARLVIVAHSMGGLVARYYLEVLGGWRHTRALMTIGTPFRGSLDALGYLANGYTKGNIDLTEVMRGFPSVYQLLPVYPVVRSGERLHRVAETTAPEGLDAGLAKDALRFHREIEKKARCNDASDPHRYAILPIVGTHQPTWQSAAFDGTGVTLSRALPPGVDRFFGDGGRDGDGTVGICSAAPLEQSEVYSDVFVAETHGCLQHNPQVLASLIGRITKMQARTLGKLRGPEPVPDPGQLGIGLAMEDHYAPADPVIVRAEVFGPAEPKKLTAVVEHVATGATTTLDLRRVDDGWAGKLRRRDVRAGVHRIAVGARGEGRYPPPIHDLFEVGG